MKEHLLGRQHLQMITEEFEKEAHMVSKMKPTISSPLENVEKTPSDHEDESEMSEGTKLTTLSDVMETLLQHDYGKLLLFLKTDLHYTVIACNCFS